MVTISNHFRSFDWHVVRMTCRANDLPYEWISGSHLFGHRIAYLSCVKDGLNYDLCLSLDLNTKEGLTMWTSESNDAFISHLKD